MKGIIDNDILTKEELRCQTNNPQSLNCQQTHDPIKGLSSRLKMIRLGLRFGLNLTRNPIRSGKSKKTRVSPGIRNPLFWGAARFLSPIFTLNE
jgi:hypothetical protein